MKGLQQQRMAKKPKLNSIRQLVAKNISHEIYTYDSNIRDAQLVAAAIGLPPENVFKTLVAEAQSSRHPILVMLPCNTSLNLKRLAKALGAKKAALASFADAENLTGLKVGGISALALMHKRWPVYLDRRGGSLSQLAISAGERGIQVQLEAQALVTLLGCDIIDVADDMAES